MLVLGAGRGVHVQAGEVETETPAMAAEARRETRLGAEGDEEGDGLGLRNTLQLYYKPQDFITFVPPLSMRNAWNCELLSKRVAGFRRSVPKRF